jgi:hypothetical protein
VRALRIVLGLVALVLAAVALLLAVDVGRWRAQIAAGDRTMAARPAADIAWTPSTLLPSDPARSLVAPDDDIALREAIRDFVIARHTGRGFDNGAEQALRREIAEAALEGVVLTGSTLQVAQADVLLGVLAFNTSSAPAGVNPPGQRSVDAFTEAARLDPSDTAAKFDLELVLRALTPAGTRPGSNPSAGSEGHGGHGAGAGLPGSGF